MEMFEQQKVFKIEDYIKMSEFLNLFVFRILWNGYMGMDDSVVMYMLTKYWDILYDYLS